VLQQRTMETVGGDDKRKTRIEQKHKTKGKYYEQKVAGKEPHPLFWWVNTEAFGLCSAFLIVSNSIYIGVQTDFQIRREIDKVQKRPLSRDFEWIVGDISFCILFSVELVLRVAAQRTAFLFGHEKEWNLFDVTVVFTSMVEVATDLAGLQLNIGISVLRTLRVVRIIRVLRSANVCSVVRNLKTMLYSLIGSASSFCSAIVLLGAVMYIFGLLFMQGVRGHLIDHPDTPLLRDVEKYYGSLDRTLWTLICCVTGGYDWGPVSKAVTEVGPFYVFFFLLYISFVLLGLLNILNGIFVNAALQSSAMNRELAIDSHMAKRETMIEDMVALFLEADEDRSGTLTFEEFQCYLQDEKIKAYFMALELDMSSVVKIFDLLDTDATGELELFEFVEGCISLRGNAKMVDISIMQKEYSNMMDKFDLDLRPMIRGMEESLKNVDQNVEKLEKKMKERTLAPVPAPPAPSVGLIAETTAPAVLQNMEA